MKPSVLLIDDSEMITKFVGRYLSKRYDALAFSKGSEAISYLKDLKNVPDCIITDYCMPGDMNGSELIEELKNNHPEIPVIVLSGSTNIDQKVECIKKGAYDFVEKPFNPKELEARIARTLDINNQLKKESHAV